METEKKGLSKSCRDTVLIGYQVLIEERKRTREQRQKKEKSKNERKV